MAWSRWTLAVLVASAVGCRTEQPPRRVARFLQEVAPRLQLGQRLADARAAYPTVVVQRRGEVHDYFPGADTTSIQPVAVSVQPPPPSDSTVSSDAAVQGVEFVTSPSTAAGFARRVAEEFQAPPRISCGRLAPSGRDSILTFDTRGRGGVTLTFPESRGEDSLRVSHIFVYAGPWRPDRVIRDYVPARCAYVHLRSGRWRPGGRPRRPLT